jgi:hypothetical protein
MKKTILLIAAVILAVFAVVGAGCIGADPIVGEWKAGNMPVTFNEDGTGSFTVTFRFLEPSTMTLPGHQLRDTRTPTPSPLPKMVFQWVSTSSLKME